MIIMEYFVSQYKQCRNFLKKYRHLSIAVKVRKYRPLSFCILFQYHCIRYVGTHRSKPTEELQKQKSTAVLGMGSSGSDILIVPYTARKYPVFASVYNLLSTHLQIGFCLYDTSGSGTLKVPLILGIKVYGPIL